MLALHRSRGLAAVRGLWQTANLHKSGGGGGGGASAEGSGGAACATSGCGGGAEGVGSAVYGGGGGEDIAAVTASGSCRGGAAVAASPRDAAVEQGTPLCSTAPTSAAPDDVGIARTASPPDMRSRRSFEYYVGWQPPAASSRRGWRKESHATRTLPWTALRDDEPRVERFTPRAARRPRRSLSRAAARSAARASADVETAEEDDETEDLESDRLDLETCSGSDNQSSRTLRLRRGAGERGGGTTSPAPPDTTQPATWAYGHSSSSAYPPHSGRHLLANPYFRKSSSQRFPSRSNASTATATATSTATIVSGELPWSVLADAAAASAAFNAFASRQLPWSVLADARAKPMARAPLDDGTGSAPLEWPPRVVP